jgi:hypothetical protein
LTEEEAKNPGERRQCFTEITAAGLLVPAKKQVENSGFYLPLQITPLKEAGAFFLPFAGGLEIHPGTFLRPKLGR